MENLADPLTKLLPARKITDWIVRITILTTNGAEVGREYIELVLTIVYFISCILLMMNVQGYRWR